MESICSGLQCSEEWGSITFSLFFRYVPAARRFLLNEVTPVPLRSRRTENIVERFFNGEWSLADAVSRLSGGVVLYVRTWLCSLF